MQIKRARCKKRPLYLDINMVSVNKGVVRPRWADVTGDDNADDEAEEEEEEDVFVSVRLPNSSSAYVAMEARDTVSNLNLWLEKTLGAPGTSFVLRQNGECLTRRRSMARLAPACVLRLTSRTKPSGHPRGMLVLHERPFVKRRR